MMAGGEVNLYAFTVELRCLFNMKVSVKDKLRKRRGTTTLLERTEERA